MGIRGGARLSLLIAAIASSATAGPQPGSPAPAPSSAWTFLAQDTFRVESWRFFEPHPGGGNPDYHFAANRLLLQVRRAMPRIEFRLAVQHVGLAGLPPLASGPGALGTGALYFDQGGRRRHPQQLYLRYANLRLKRILPGLDLQVGRQGYASGNESVTREPAIEAVKRQRMDARLIGEFEWSIYQRGYDGVRADWSRDAARLTGIVFMPTQGGFAREAGKTMTNVVVAGATFGLLPSASRPHTDLQAFIWRYADERLVSGRPDNSGRTALAADVGITTVGGTAIGAYPAGGGQLDLLGWLAVQRGRWYGDDHSAVSAAVEAGYQWPRGRWSPWLRAGLSHASGDADGADTRHETFFPMLPTVRRFSQTAVYSTMNLDDLFVQALAFPTAAVSLRLDLHRLWLASATDRWYAGSGATLSQGSNFGYVTRPSNGSTTFGTSVEASAAWTVTRHWSVNGFAGALSGGPVVTGTFFGHRLWFVYGETALRIGG
ncbi:MAG: alginate export family protein [Vicinamibacterales bacterium]